MEEREYIEAYLDGKGSDRLIWSGVASFGHAPNPVSRVTSNISSWTQIDEDGVKVTETVAPSGTLVSRFRGKHPISHPVSKLDGMRALYEVEADTVISLDLSLVDDYDPVLHRLSVNPTPLQRLLQYDMGLENFYALYADHPKPMRQLLEVMMVNYEEECRLIAKLPMRSVRMVENTSTTMISPDLYKELGVPQVAKAAEIFHESGKVVIAHMCGLLKSLLPHFRAAGIDGVHSLTPPPVGDTTFEMAWDVMGDSWRVGGRLGTTCWLGKSVEEIRDYLRPLISEERIRKSPFMLEIQTDGMEDIPEGEWERVRDAVEGLF